MPYIGRDLNRGNYLKLDDISSSFNSSTKTFNLTVGGSAFTPGSAFSILVSVGGVIQEPESAYQVNNSEITFANAPTAQDGFFCIALGVPLGIGVPGSGTVNGPQIAKPFNYDGFFYLNDANNRVGINSSIPTSALDVSGTIKASSFSGPIGNPSGISTFYDLRVTNNLTVEGTTTTLDTNLVGVDRVEVGANSNSIVGVAVTQSGTADILRLYDGASQVVTVDDTGKVGLGTAIPGEALHLGDNQKIALGYGEDLTLTHQGTNSVIFSETGELHIHARGAVGDFYLKADDDIFIRVNGANEGIKVIGGDAVQLFHAGNKRAQTLSNGFQTQHQTPIFQLFGENASGTRASNGYLNFYLRDGNSNSYSVARVLGATDNSNGGYGCLQFQTAFANSLTTKMIITREGNVGINSESPAAKLDVNGDTRIQGNVNVVGVLTATSALKGGSLRLNDYQTAYFGSSNDLQIYHNPNINVIDSNTTDLYIKHGNEFMIKAIGDGPVELYHDNVKRFETTTVGARVTHSGATTRLVVGSTDASGAWLVLDGDSNGDGAGSDYAYIEHSSSGHLNLINPVGGVALKGGGVNSVVCQEDAEVVIYHNGNRKFETQTTGAKVTGILDVTGNITGSGDLTLTDTATDSAAGPEFKLIRNSASPANADYLGQIKFAGKSSTGVERNYAKITGKILDVDNGNEDGILEFAHIRNGSQTITGRWRSDSLQLLNSTNLTVDGNSTFNQDVTFIGDSTHLTWDRSNRTLQAQDGVYLKFGTQGDYQIYHDGANAVHRVTGDGDLKILVEEKNFIVQGTGGHQIIKGIDNGAVQLYHNNTLRLETFDNSPYVGVSVTNDLILNGAGDVAIRWAVGGNAGSNFKWGMYYAHSDGALRLFDNVNSRTVSVWKNTGAIELNYAASKKFETTTNGVQITGSLTVTDDIFLSDANTAYFGTNNDMRIYHSGTHGYVKNTVGNLYFMTTNSEYGALMYANAGVELRYDNVKKLETTSTGVLCLRYAFDTDNYITCNNSANTMEFVLGDSDIGEFSGSGLMLRDNMQLRLGTGNDLRLYHDGTSNYISNRTGNLYIEAKSGETAIQIIPDGAVDLRHNGSKRLETTSDGVDFGTGGANDILCISGQTIHRTGGNGCGLHFSSSVILPTNAAGTTGDQTCSLGNGSNRFTSLNVMQLQVYDRVGTDLKPYASNTYDLGSTTYRWRNIYTNDLNLSNEGGSNDVDGTWGSYTIQEGEDDLFLINKRSGKKYKFNLTEVS